VSPGRLLAAGAAAGLTNLVLGFALAHFMGVARMQAALRAHGLREIGQPSDMLPHIVVRLLTGLGVTLLFAALTPRFGEGPRAALVALVFGWTFLYAYRAWGHAHIGLFTPGMAWSFAAVGAVELALTILVGAWIAVGSNFWRL
jgi:hypothetical protein